MSRSIWFRISSKGNFVTPDNIITQKSGTIQDRQAIQQAKKVDIYNFINYNNSDKNSGKRQA